MSGDDVVDILLVDDRDEGLVALESILSMPGVNLITARSGAEALMRITDRDIGLVLMDVQMPGMDGFETARRMRSNPRHKLTPIIFVTAIDKDDRYISEGYEAGAVDYLFKPFEPGILKSKVNVFLELFRKSRQLQLQADLIRESEIRERYLRLTELEVESLKRYRNLADAIPHLVWRARADGSLDYVNKGWTDYTGLSLEESVGSGWQSVFRSEDLASLLKVWMQSMEGGKSFDLECLIADGKKNFRWHWLQMVAETTPFGAVVAWLGTCTDIHDRKMTAEKLMAAEKAAKMANRAKTTFLANMSHEIRTPMNSVLGFTELMRDSSQTEKERLDCITTVQRNGEQLLQIIDEILDISKVESGHLRLECVAVDLGLLLKDVRSLLRIQAEEKGLTLEFQMVRIIPGAVFSDPTRLRQILVNLIANAIKFTARGGIHVEIDWLQIEDGAGKLQFRVRDTGIGIEPIKAEKLFRPFTQLDSSTTRHFGGSGLGLALSREFARAMGGDVILESSHESVGSCFLAEVVGKSVPEFAFLESLEIERLPEINAWTNETERPLSGLDLLLVDDLTDNRELLSHILTQAGARVDFAENGREGVRKALVGNHHLVLMDIQMPLLDGYEATKELRSKNYQKPIVALTAYALREERERCFEAGCTDHVTKPIKINALIDKIAQLVTQKGVKLSV